MAIDFQSAFSKTVVIAKTNLNSNESSLTMATDGEKIIIFVSCFVQKMPTYSRAILKWIENTANLP